MTHITIALDAMGGDKGADVVVPAAFTALKKHPNLKLILVGDQEFLERLIANYPRKYSDRIDIHHASQVVDMGESPSQALRGKKDSSMRVAVNLVKEGVAQAAVSSGNTGALMATAKFVLKTLPGIDRPAICSELPNTGKKVRMLDLGANVDSCAEHLLQFAVMGSILISSVDNIPEPSVCLLNIGVEEIKGNDQVKRTAQLLSETNAVNYQGYIEGDDIFYGKTDLVVCDGFVGNVCIKTCEGTVKLMGGLLKKSFKSNALTKAMSYINFPILRKLSKSMDPSRYNGASLLGLQGIVIKSHGGANQVAFVSAIEEAIKQVKQNVPEKIGQKVADLLSEGHLT